MEYKAPLFLFNAHLETIYPSLIRRVDGLRPYYRERITTPDDDFLDLDWIQSGSKRLLIISHGLEGSADRAYIKGLAKAATKKGFDALAWNYRGCSGEVNRQLRFYHSGATEDLRTVIKHVFKTYAYEEIYLAGFSLGGNLTLKYLGEQAVDPRIRKAVTFSVPLHLSSSCAQISRHWIYSNRFLKSLKAKVMLKHQRFPELSIAGIDKIKTLKAFDDRYTAPVHGFADAEDYYERNSSLYFLKGITTPTLIINAMNDPFLSKECFPEEQLRENPYVKLLVPVRGGHVGFSQFTRDGIYWSEARALHFLER